MKLTSDGDLELQYLSYIKEQMGESAYKVLTSQGSMMIWRLVYSDFSGQHTKWLNEEHSKVDIYNLIWNRPTEWGVITPWNENKSWKKKY